MASPIYRPIRKALKNLNPRDVRERAERPITVGLIASGSEGFAEMEDMLVPPGSSRARQSELARVLYRVGEPGAPGRFDVVLCEEELLAPPGAFYFYFSDPRRTVRNVLAARQDLKLTLARNFVPFREPVIEEIIRNTAWENAAFALMTALPDVVPSLAELAWAVGEFASDTAVLTVNQVRMAFLIAAASDREVGYQEQAAQIGAIVGGAVGWRALARELVGKIPFGGGLVPKAAIAYAGTFTVGLGLERFYRIGSELTRAERRAVYREALERGREVVAALRELRRSA